MEPITEDADQQETEISGEIEVETEVKQTWRQVKNTKLKWSPGVKWGGDREKRELVADAESKVKRYAEMEKFARKQKAINKLETARANTESFRADEADLKTKFVERQLREVESELFELKMTNNLLRGSHKMTECRHAQDSAAQEKKQMVSLINLWKNGCQFDKEKEKLKGLHASMAEKQAEAEQDAVNALEEMNNIKRSRVITHMLQMSRSSTAESSALKSNTRMWYAHMRVDAAMALQIKMVTACKQRCADHVKAIERKHEKAMLKLEEKHGKALDDQKDFYIDKMRIQDEKARAAAREAKAEIKRKEGEILKLEALIHDMNWKTGLNTTVYTVALARKGNAEEAGRLLAAKIVITLMREKLERQRERMIWPLSIWREEYIRIMAKKWWLASVCHRVYARSVEDTARIAAEQAQEKYDKEKARQERVRAAALAELDGKNQIAMQQLEDELEETHKREVTELKEAVADQDFACNQLKLKCSQMEVQVRVALGELADGELATAIKLRKDKQGALNVTMDGISLNGLDIMAISPPRQKLLSPIEARRRREESREVAMELVGTAARWRRQVVQGRATEAGLIRAGRSPDAKALGLVLDTLERSAWDKSRMPSDDTRAMRRMEEACEQASSDLVALTLLRRTELGQGMRRVFNDLDRGELIEMLARWTERARLTKGGEDAVAAAIKKAATDTKRALREQEESITKPYVAQMARLQHGIRHSSIVARRTFLHGYFVWASVAPRVVLQKLLNVWAVRAAAEFRHERASDSHAMQLEQMTAQVMSISGELVASERRQGEATTMLGDTSGQLSVMTASLHEAVKTGHLERHSLKREMRNAQSTAKQLREDNRLKSDAIALARGDKARLSESLSYEKKLKKVARKEEERVASLYAEAAQCLQSEHSHLQGLNKQLLQLHWAVAKVFAGLEGWVKRMSGDDHGEIQRGAIGGCSGSDPGNAPGTLPSHIKERSDIVSWDRKMLDQVYRWLQLKMAHDDKQGQHFAVSSRNPTPVSSVSSRSPSRASPSRLPWQTTASLANTPQSPYALPRVVTPQRPKPMFYDTDVI